MIENSWSHFCEHTSIHGLHYIYSSHHNRKRRYRVLWTFVFLSMITLTIWNCTNNVIDYLKFNVKTSISYQTKQELHFPAITLCNENTFRKSAVANTPFVFMMSALTAKSVKEITSKAELNDKTCSTSNTTAPDIFAMKRFLDEYMKKSMTTIMELTTSNSTAAVKCWWNSIEFVCDGNFLNHPDTLGTCFTFNLNEDIINAGKDVNGSMSSFGYGLNTTNYLSRKQRSFGPNNGLRLLLNVNQLDYCGVGRIWYGAGFRTYVHDSQSFISYYINPPLQLSPGHDTSVAIRTVQFNRKTEHMGLCDKFVYLWLSPFATVYSELACFVQCGTQFIWNKCHCFMPYGQVYTKKASEALNVPEQSLRLCTPNDAECIISYQQKLIDINYAAECVLCKRPCQETKYEFTVTSSRLVPNTFTNDTVINEKNFLSVNYYFDDMDLFMIEESQAITIVDLFTYFGGIIGLFLGMSTLSTGELFYQIVYWFHYSCEKRKSRKINLKNADRRRFSRRMSLAVVDNVKNAYHRYNTRNSVVNDSKIANRMQYNSRTTLAVVEDPKYANRLRYNTRMSIAVVEDLFENRTNHHMRRVRRHRY